MRGLETLVRHAHSFLGADGRAPDPGSPRPGRGGGGIAGMNGGIYRWCYGLCNGPADMRHTPRPAALATGIRPGYRLEIRTSGFRVPVIRRLRPYAYLASSPRVRPRTRRDRYRDGLTPDVRRGLSRVSYPVGSLPVRTLRPLTDHRRDDVLAHPRTPSITPSITPSTLTPVPPRVYDAPEPRRRSHASCERRGRLCHRLDEDVGVAFGLEIAHTDARAEQ